MRICEVEEELERQRRWRSGRRQEYLRAREDELEAISEADVGEQARIHRRASARAALLADPHCSKCLSSMTRNSADGLCGACRSGFVAE